MKKFIIFLVGIFAAATVSAQVPYFANPVGDNHFYGYTSVKSRPGINAQETYTTFHYGIKDYFSVGMDLYTGVGSNYVGYSVRGKFYNHEYFNIGWQFTPSFDLNYNHKYSYSTAAIYMNGKIYDGLFWCSNTWYGINHKAENTIKNWWYLGYSIQTSNAVVSVTPMIGLDHSWKFDRDINPLAGVYVSVRDFNFYLWCDQYHTKNPRITVGIDFTFGCK